MIASPFQGATTVLDSVLLRDAFWHAGRPRSVLRPRADLALHQSRGGARAHREPLRCDPHRYGGRDRGALDY